MLNIYPDFLQNSLVSSITFQDCIFLKNAFPQRTSFREGMLCLAMVLFTMSIGHLFLNINDVKQIHIHILGRPVLNPSLSLLSTSCLGESSDLFEDELEPIRISDLLFEERAVDILDHDIITRIVSRREQIKMLLDTLKRNKEDCFHFFLYILQNDFENICNALNKPTFAAPRVSMFDGPRSLTYEVARAQGIKLNIYTFFWAFF